MDENATNNFIIPEWKQSKDAILQAYFQIINNYSRFYNRFIISKQYAQTELYEWRAGVRMLFLQIREYEKELKQITRQELNIKLQDIEELANFTDLLLDCQTVRDVRSIARSFENDPIKYYEDKAY